MPSKGSVRAPLRWAPFCFAAVTPVLLHAFPAQGRCAGLVAVEVAELQVTGTFKVKGQWRALGYGPWRCPIDEGGDRPREAYLIREGSYLYDGIVVKVTKDAVFIQPTEGDPPKPTGKVVLKKVQPAK